MYGAGPDGERRGRTTHTVMERSSYTRAAMSDVVRLMPMVAVGALVAGAVRAMRTASWTEPRPREHVPRRYPTDAHELRGSWGGG